jgi:epoxyqueuosine reductase
MIDIVADLARTQGAVLVGWASLHRNELARHSLLSASEASRYHSALVIVINHHNAALAPAASLPTPAYEADYRRINVQLDDITTNLQDYLKSHRVRCRAVPASQTLDRVHHRGLISHRALAEQAGLGRRGRNNLLVTPGFKSRVRLASLLSELSVPPRLEAPLPNFCTACDVCRKACPAGAIGQSSEDFRLDLCLLNLERIHRKDIAPQICGVCLAVCPGINTG